MALDKNINWDELADATENYTGADLQALLYNAQLESIHSKLDNLRAKMLRVETEDDKGVMHASFTRFKLSESADLAESMSAEQRSNVIRKVETIRDNIIKQVDDSVGAAKKMEHNVPEITQDHLQKALSELVPSISPQERRRYQQIYGSFLQSRGADFQDSTTALQNQRQTLA
jgi:peroxin-1